MTIVFKAQLKAGIQYDTDAKVYVTYAPALGIYSQGETKLQAKNALEDAVRSFLIVSYNKGVLDEILKSADLSPGDEYISVEERILEKNV